MSTISSSTTSSTAYKVTADTTGTLVIQTGSTPTTAVTIDTSQNVGIGTASPRSVAGYTTLALNNTNGGLFDISAAGTRIATIGADTGNLTINALANMPMTFFTNNAERMRINAGAPILCLSGGSTTATGTGIAFPATQSASSDVNTLDDYEEGTWTPSVGGTATYTTQLGRYTKIGNKVFIEGVIAINTIGTGSVGDISGLPFTTNASSPLGSISVGFYSVSATSITYISATLAAGQNNINLRVQGNAGGSMGAVTFFQNSTTIYFTGQYTA